MSGWVNLMEQGIDDAECGVNNSPKKRDQPPICVSSIFAMADRTASGAMCPRVPRIIKPRIVAIFA